jgi:transposase-like protein
VIQASAAPRIALGDRVSEIRRILSNYQRYLVWCIERLNQEIKRRTHVVRIFPNPQSCLRLVRALAVETHEEWLESPRYLNMDDLREHKKQQMRVAA